MPFIPISQRNTSKVGSFIPISQRNLSVPAKPVSKVKKITLPDSGSFNVNLGDISKNPVLTPRSYAGLETQSDTQRDHMIAVALGGTSDPDNLKIQAGEASKYKDNVEKYYISQYKAGKVNLNEAVLKVATWDNVDIPGQESYNKMIMNQKKGFLEKNVWDKMAKNPTGKKVLELAGKAPEALDAIKKVFGFAGITSPFPTEEERAKTPMDVLKETGKALTGTIPEVIKQEQQNYQAYKTAVQTKGTPFSERLGTGMKVVSGNMNVLLSPISTIFETAKKSRIFAPAAELVGLPFAITGNTLGWVSDEFVDSLRGTGAIDQKTADNIKPAFREMSSLVGQVVLGGLFMDWLMKGGKLEDKVIEDKLKEAKAKELKIEKAKTEPIELSKGKVETPIFEPKIKEGFPVIKTGEVAPTITPEAQIAKPEAITPEKGIITPKFYNAQEVSIPRGATESINLKTGKTIPLKVVEKIIIPKELQPLAQEAMKYKNAEDFIQSIRLKALEKKPRNATELESIKLELAKIPENKLANNAVDLLEKYIPNEQGWFQSAKDFYKQATEGKEAFDFVEKFNKEKPEIKPQEAEIKSSKIKLPSGKISVRQATQGLREAGYTPDEISQILSSTKEVEKGFYYAEDIIRSANNLSQLPQPVEIKPIVPEITGGKVSGIAKSVEAKSIEQGLVKKGFDKLAEYDPAIIKEQSQMMSDIMKRDIEMAKRLALSKEELPQGLKAPTVFSAIEDYAMETKNGELARDLANSPIATEISIAGQTLRLSAERTPDSATAKIRDLMKTREKAVERKMGEKSAKQAKAEIKKSLTDKISKTKTGKYNWENFLLEIRC